MEPAEPLAAASYIALLQAGREATFYVSPQIQALLGFSPEEYRADPGGLWVRQLHPDDRQRVLDGLLDSFIRQVPFIAQYRMLTRAGATVWLHEDSRLLQNGLREGLLMYGTWLDITAFRQQETRLGQLAVAFQICAEGMVIADAAGMMIAVNPAFTDITGYSAAEALGQSVRLLLEGLHDRAFYQALWTTLEETGQWQGEVWSRRKSGALYSKRVTIGTVRDSTGAIIHYVTTFSDLSILKPSQTHFEHLAHHDALTGLPNRLLFIARVDHALQRAGRTGRRAAVLSLDLDRFKTVNDSLGHPVGDRLLQAVAGRLAGILPKEATLARLGDDEFGILLEEMAETQAALWVAQQLLANFSQPFDIDQQALHLTASIGISLYPDDGQDAATLIKNADAAMCRIKEQAPNSYQLYTPAITDAALRRILLGKDLRNALEQNELVLRYQPQVDLHSGRIVAMEALLRWQHPRLGYLRPGEFLAIAKEIGLILPISEWVLHSACRQARAWREQGLPPINMTINCFAEEITHPSFIGNLQAALTANALPPSQLELEVTESRLLEDPGRISKILQDLQGLGIRLVMDDFGTGYSSLGYLKRFSFEALKIDQSFIQDIISDPDSAAIVRAIIAMARNLRLRVIAEGTETEAQARYLWRYGCELAQGNYFSEPLLAAEATTLLHQRTPLQPLARADAAPLRTLLIVDDDPLLRKMLERLLSLDGYHILTADCPANAWDLLATQSIGVILSDNSMPGMTGIEFLSRVKHLYPRAMRILFTSDTELQVAADAVNKGAVYKFLTKPWNNDLLRANLREAFREHELAQENERLRQELEALR